MKSTPAKPLWQRRAWTFLGSIVLLLAVGAVIAAIGWIKSNQVKAAMSQPPPPEMPVAVTLFAPQTTQFRRQTVVVGSVLSDQSVRLRNELTGVVTKVSMTPGGLVKAGDVLVELDDRLEQAELMAAKATLQMSLSSLERSEKLNLANANSAQELDIAKSEAVRAEAEMDRLRTMIDRKKIIAQFDARVGLFDLSPGQYLVEGTEITTLEGVADFLNVDFSMPAHVADEVAIGDTVSMRANESSAALEATIVALDSRADPVSRSLIGRARLDAPPASLLPGDAVRVTISYGPQIQAYLVPATSIRRSPTGTRVYLAVEQDAGPDGEPTELRAQSQIVQIAGGGGTLSRVVAGIESGDQVVADGSFKVVDGVLLAPLPGESQ